MMHIHPQDTIGYWLTLALHSFSTVFSEVLRVHCVEQRKSYIITPTQWAVMALLDHVDGQTIGAIVQSLDVAYPTVTGVIARLEQNGLVTRVHDSEDRRVVKVFLTVEGKNIICSLNTVVEQFNKRVSSGAQNQAFCEQLQCFITTVQTIMPDIDRVQQ